MSDRVLVVTCGGVPLVFADLAALREYAQQHRHPEHYNELQVLVGVIDEELLAQDIPLIGFGYTIRSCAVRKAGA